MKTKIFYYLVIVICLSGFGLKLISELPNFGAKPGATSERSAGDIAKGAQQLIDRFSKEQTK